MNTEYAVGKVHIRFESRASRRWFVALFYAVLAVYVLTTLFLSAKGTTGAWTNAGCGTLAVALLLFFWSVAGDLNARGDEREMHHRGHAYFRAYRILGIFMSSVFFCYLCFGGFGGHNWFASLVPPALRGSLTRLPIALFVAFVFLYVSLPQAILLWTEPDMDSEKEPIS